LRKFCMSLWAVRVVCELRANGDASVGEEAA
jgi:hypothetical protein